MELSRTHSKPQIIAIQQIAQRRGRWLAAATGLLVIPAAALADKNWNTAVEVGNWNVPANWLENAVPTASDNVNILFNEAALHSVTLDTDFSSTMMLNLDNKSGTTNTTLIVGTGVSLTVGDTSIGIDGMARISQSGGAITINGIEYVGLNGTGSVLQTGGVHNLGSDNFNGELHIAQAQGSSGTYTLSDGQLLAQFEQIGLSGQGLFVQTGGINQTTYGPHGGGTFSVGDSSLGTGAYTLQGGTLTTGGEHWGYLGPGVMNMSGGYHDTGGLNLGVDGAGTYNQTGGVTEIDGGIYIGGFNAPGTYNLSGTGQLNVFGMLFIGGNYSAPASTGVLHISGGTVTMSSQVPSAEMRLWASPGSALIIDGTGKLDLNKAGLIEQTTPATRDAQIAALVPLINQGSNGGLWTGNGITSSVAAANHAQYALGLFDNTAVGKAQLHGPPLGADDLFVIIAHLGDANDNGVVDIQDQSLVTNHWQSAQSTWSAGDLNLDGFVDLQDLTLVTNNWQTTSIYALEPEGLQAAAGGAAPLAAPEPASLTALLVPLLLGGWGRHTLRCHSRRPGAAHV